jgi:hypothetical protein
MPTARFDPADRLLSIQLTDDETEAQLRFLGEWLPQFLDRDLRDLGLAIAAAMKPTADLPKVHVSSSLADATPPLERAPACVTTPARRPGAGV